MIYVKRSFYGGDEKQQKRLYLVNGRTYLRDYIHIGVCSVLATHCFVISLETVKLVSLNLVVKPFSTNEFIFDIV